MALSIVFACVMLAILVSILAITGFTIAEFFAIIGEAL
jgi:hypothetical protein